MAKDNRTSDLFTKLIKQEIGIELTKEHRFHSVRRFQFDYAIIPLKIAIEQEGGVYNGRAHGSVTGILRDMQKYTLAASEGWLVLRFTPEQMTSVESLDLIAKTVKYRKEQLGEK